MTDGPAGEQDADASVPPSSPASIGTNSMPTVDPADPAAVTVAFGDDYLAMLSDPTDAAARSSPWASAAGMALMNTRADQAVEDGITAEGPWAVRVDDVTDGETTAVATGCIDVSRVAGYRDGTAEPWPGDAIRFSAILERNADGWLVSGFSIPGEACSTR